ncbi:CoA transferase [Aerococcus urinae]|nr:CoA transferase [Aerococcus urinae]
MGKTEEKGYYIMNIQLLDGVKVIDFSTMVAAPTTARVMADWGADVLKVEAPSGDQLRGTGATMNVTATEDENPIFETDNLNKKGITLNLKSEEGYQIMMQLLEEADVFISNIRIHSLEKLGLGYETLKAKFPHLIWGHFSGYGTKGEEAHRPGYDVVGYWARGGFMASLAPVNHPPISAPSGVGDSVAGLSLLSGILAALLKQRQTGQGEEVRVSLLGSAIFCNKMMIVSSQYEDHYPKDRMHPNNPFLQSYQTKDGEWIMLCLVRYESEFPRFMKIIGLEEYIDDESVNTLDAFQKNPKQSEFVKQVEAAIGNMESQDLINKMLAEDFTFERAQTFDEIPNDKQAWANNYLENMEFGKDGKRVAMPASPVQFSDDKKKPFNHAPRLGEHNQEILTDLGYSEEDIQSLKEKGVI